MTDGEQGRSLLSEEPRRTMAWGGKHPEEVPMKPDEQTEATDAQAAAEAEEQGPAWEEIEAGRFMPRRIRGSFKGRALG